jgi:hypothetical protein
MNRRERMKNVNRTYQLLIAFSFILVMLSCTKEKDPVAVTPVETAHFDSGYLIVKLLDDPAFLDSICYANLTKGTSFKIDKTEFFGFNSMTNPITSISRPLTNGTTNDQVQCCFYLNASMEVGVAFENIHLDSVSTVTTGNNVEFYIEGNY